MAHQPSQSDRAPNEGLTARAEAALTPPGNAARARHPPSQRPTFQVAMARHMAHRQTQRPRLDRLRSAAASPSPHLPCTPRLDGSKSRLGNRLHRTSPPLRRLQHLRTTARIHLERILVTPRYPWGISLRSHRLDRDSIRGGNCDLDLAKRRSKKRRVENARGVAHRRHSRVRIDCYQRPRSSDWDHYVDAG